MARIILTPQLVGGWLSEMCEPVERAAAAGFDGIVEGRIEGALAVNKAGKAMLLTRLQAELSAEAAAVLMGGAPVDVEGALEVGWQQETKVGRAAWGWCACWFATKGAGRVEQEPKP